MNASLFGKFLLAPGVIGLAIAAYLYHSVNNEEFLTVYREARARSAYANNYNYVAPYRIKQDETEKEALIFASIGGLIAFIGVGLIASSSAPKSESEG